MPRTKHKAVIQTNKITGVQRVFYRKKVNGVNRVVETHTSNLFRYSVTGYANIPNVLRHLSDCISVGMDECVMFMGENVDEVLGLDNGRSNRLMKARQKIKDKFNMTDEEITALFTDKAA